MGGSDAKTGNFSSIPMVEIKTASSPEAQISEVHTQPYIFCPLRCPINCAGYLSLFFTSRYFKDTFSKILWMRILQIYFPHVTRKWLQKERALTRSWLRFDCMNGRVESKRCILLFQKCFRWDTYRVARFLSCTSGAMDFLGVGGMHDLMMSLGSDIMLATSCGTFCFGGKIL